MLPEIDAPIYLYNKDAEQDLIGAALIDPSVIWRVEIAPEDFYVHRNRFIWSAMTRLSKGGIDPDLITLSEQLKRDGKLDEIGGIAALAELASNTFSSQNAEKLTRIISDYSRRRSVLQSANRLAQIANNIQANPEEEIAAEMERLVTGAKFGQGAVQWQAALSELMDDVEYRANNPAETWGIPTGFADYDAITGGLQPSEVLYIGGAPGAGKSILSMQMGMQMAKAGYPGVIFSLEMRASQVVRRAVSALSKVETRKLKTGKLEGDDWTNFTRTIDESANWPLFITDDSATTTNAMRADLARLKAQHGIQWFVLDYLILLPDGSGKLDDNERSALLSRRVKTIAKDLALAGITVNSVTKDAMTEDSRPEQKNIRGSGQVIHDADLVAILSEHIPGKFEAKNPALRTLTFVKGRELEQPRSSFHLLKFDKIPAFGDVALDKVNLNGARK